MKKFILTHKLLCIIIASVVVVGTVCAIVLPIALKHKHTYSSDWSSDANNHWHVATCKHTDEKADYNVHDFSEWTVETEAGLHTDRVESRSCKVCGYKEEKTIAGTAKHTYQETWTHDEEKHWKESTCEGHDPVLKIEEAAHDFSEWTTKIEAGYGINKVEERDCTVCGYHEENEIENSALSPKQRSIEVDLPADITFNNQVYKAVTSDMINISNSREGEMKIYYRDYNGGEWWCPEDTNPASYPKKAGVYLVKVTISATPEWQEAESDEVSFVINKYKLLLEGKSFASESSDEVYFFDLTETDLGIDEVIVYSKVKKNVGRYTLTKNDLTIKDAEVNFEFTLEEDEIEWVVKDDTDTFRFRNTKDVVAGSVHEGSIMHGSVSIGDKLTLINEVKVSGNINYNYCDVTITKIELIKDGSLREVETATKDEIVQITFTTNPASFTVKSICGIVSAFDMGEVNDYQKAQETSELTWASNEVRVFNVKINSIVTNILEISNKETCDFVKLFNAETGEEITLNASNRFSVPEGTNVLIIIKQTLTKANHKVAVKQIQISL